MASTARQPKPQRKGGPEPARRAPAWTGARASPTFSPSHTPRPQNAQPPGAAANFPSLGHPNGARPDAARDRVLQSLTGLTGTTVTLTTRTGQRYEGVVGSTSGEGDTTGVTLKDAKDLTTLGAPLKDSLFIAATNIDTYTSGPADSKPTNGDTFRTDTDISAKKGLARERELQAWVPSIDNSLPSTDEDTFGAAAMTTSWDQFSANEQLFGVTVNFDEEVYTTKLDRNAPDFKERERKAQRIANEIMGTATTNSHIAEERGHEVDDSGVNEEDKYGAVVRNPNAYVPPGARKTVSNGGPPAVATKAEIPKVSVNGPDGNAVAPSQSPAPSKSSSPAPNAAPNKPPADPLPAFRDFVTHEKQRLTQKRQALQKSEMDKRMAELVKFSQSFKLNKPIPDDLVPILAKDEDKQKAIRDKATRDAQSGEARVIGASTPATASRGVLAPGKLGEAARKPNPQISASKTVTNNLDQPPSAAQKPATTSASATPGASASKPGDSKKISMFIQPIPAFRGNKSKLAFGATSNASATPVKITTSGSNGTNANPSVGGPVSPSTAAANRLNVNAPSFRSKGSVSPSLSAASASVSPKPAHKTEPAHATPNPFFGPRVIKKSTPVNVKDDFNPFKHNKVVDASQVAAMWPYSGKRYMQLYPPPPHQPLQHQPHMPPVVSPPMPPQSYEEDPAAQAAAAAAARGYVYAYPPYGYPGQPMMPGMPPGPPGGYMPGHFMQPMPYPPGMPPPNAMYSPAMGQMPPPGAYMSPPPGAYPPPPNGAQRPSMPPTPIPAHAHPYYHHQSPQMQHAVPYQMMMPPPPAGVPPPHPYDGSQQQAVQMGGHA
ncbi:hypothetical protein DFP72DRAFT_252604 [Ephemerocybe angulata]|uniref:LsmAD domain-containing protein n=1 Tax=Ephemerocybe angulata TaxID=980116 RepID=A0A8H6M677_9AGAR|nr:hypothetical protein DFP72DRAFT_252604 [Tulosesus angulatus]